jgi:hypothetical protein
MFGAANFDNGAIGHAGDDYNGPGPTCVWRIPFEKHPTLLTMSVERAWLSVGWTLGKTSLEATPKRGWPFGEPTLNGIDLTCTSACFKREVKNN